MKYIVYLTTNKINNKIYVGVHKTEDPNIFDGYIGNSINIFKANPELKHPKIPFHKEEALNLESLIVDENFIAREDTYNISKVGNIKEEKLDPPRKVNKIRKIGQYTMDGRLVKTFNTLREARAEFPNVSKVLRGTANHCHNFKFKYLE